MSSSKTKRTITVEKSTSDSNIKAKPSVFDRLGAVHSHGSSERQDICLDFANNGVCKYGSKCKYPHVTPTRDRNRERDRSSDDLRSRVPRKRDENEGDTDLKQKSLGQKKDRDSKIKSAVVVTKSNDNIDDIWPEQSDADKGSVERKHESKSRQQTSSSSHGLESESHKSSKTESRADEKKDEVSCGLQSSSSKGKNRSPKSQSRDEDDLARRKSKDRKKKKHNRSQGSQSPALLEEKPEQKHQKDILPSSKSSEKHSKPPFESRKVEASSSSTGVSLEKKPKGKDPKDEKNKSVEKRLLMLAMEPDTKLESIRADRVRSPVKSKQESSPSQGRGKDGKKDYVSPSARTKEGQKDRIESASSCKKSAKERSPSLPRSKDVHRDRSPSPSVVKDRKGNYAKPQSQPAVSLGRVIDKPRPTMEEKSGLNRESRKMEKGKVGRKRRHSSTSTGSSSSSSSSGSDSGSSSGSSTSGSSSSSSSSSDMSSDGRKPTKGRAGKANKPSGRQGFDRRSSQPGEEKEMAKGTDRSRKEKEKTTQEESRARRQAEEKSKIREIESSSGKDTYSRKEVSPGRNYKKDWEKGGLPSGQGGGIDSKKGAPLMDRDKTNRDIQYAPRSGEVLRSKHADAADYCRKPRSPGAKDDRNKPVTPVDVSRRAQSPTESLRSHHSTKPTSLAVESELEHEHDGRSSGQYRDYYSSREKAGRKEDNRFQPYADEMCSKKHDDRADVRGQGYYSHKQQHSVDPYDRSRDAAEHDREERDSRYSREHGYEEDRYPTSTDRHHAETASDVHSRAEYYSSSYRDERRSGRIDETSRKELERSDKHGSNYEMRNTERDSDARDREKSRDQRTSDYREKMRGEGIEHSSSSSSKCKKEKSTDCDSA